MAYKIIRKFDEASNIKPFTFGTAKRKNKSTTTIGILNRRQIVVAIKNRNAKGAKK
jgi:hypothetical protein